MQGGSGCVRFWTSDGECIEELSAPMGMTPRTMVATGPTQLAVTFGQRKGLSSQRPSNFNLPDPPTPGGFPQRGDASFPLLLRLLRLISSRRLLFFLFFLDLIILPR